MAEYIRFRLTAAKAGVTMAFMALVAGIVEARQSDPAQVRATPASKSFLNLHGTSGNTRASFIKLEQKYQKLDSALVKMQHKLGSYLKIRNANAQFLKISAANAKFLKLADANAKFLKIDDANAKFLKIDGTAADAQKVGGIGPDQLIQGRGQVLSNALIATSANQALLGDGSVRVLIALVSGRTPTVTLENDTSSALNFTVSGGGSPSSGTVAPNGGQSAVTPGAAPQLDIQMFGGGGGAGKVWTVTLSTASTQAGQEFVGQMLVGLL